MGCGETSDSEPEGMLQIMIDRRSLAFIVYGA